MKCSYLTTEYSIRYQFDLFKNIMQSNSFEHKMHIYEHDLQNNAIIFKSANTSISV